MRESSSDEESNTIDCDSVAILLGKGEREGMESEGAQIRYALASQRRRYEEARSRKWFTPRCSRRSRRRTFRKQWGTNRLGDRHVEEEAAIGMHVWTGGQGAEGEDAQNVRRVWEYAVRFAQTKGWQGDARCGRIQGGEVWKGKEDGVWARREAPRASVHSLLGSNPSLASASPCRFGPPHTHTHAHTHTHKQASSFHPSLSSLATPSPSRCAPSARSRKSTLGDHGPQSSHCASLPYHQNLGLILGAKCGPVVTLSFGGPWGS